MGRENGDCWGLAVASSRLKKPPMIEMRDLAESRMLLEAKTRLHAAG